MDQYAQSLLAEFDRIADPRRREGRRYPLSAILGLMVMGVLQGEDSLRGIREWAHYHWAQLCQPLGFGRPDFPAYNTLRTLLARLDMAAVDRLISAWLERTLDQEFKAVSADGKVLRGSRRAKVPGLAVVALASHELGVVLGQLPVQPGEGELDALLRLLRERPLAGRVVTLDAGLLTGEVTQVIIAGSGNYVGAVKGNHQAVKAAIDEWVAEQIAPVVQGPFTAEPADSRPVRRAPDARTVEKSRGRLEIRELWLVPADELQPYLCETWGWQGVQQVGWLRRRQQRHCGEPWQEQEVTIVTSLAVEQAAAADVLHLTRQHWSIENKVHWVRDVSFNEDRRHARSFGVMMAWARNLALTLLRGHGFRFVPDGWRFASANLGLVLQWLTGT